MNLFRVSPDSSRSAAVIDEACFIMRKHIGCSCFGMRPGVLRLGESTGMSKPSLNTSHTMWNTCVMSVLADLNTFFWIRDYGSVKDVSRQSPLVDRAEQAVSKITKYSHLNASA